jgi:hypothetical protein
MTRTKQSLIYEAHHQRRVQTVEKVSATPVPHCTRPIQCASGSRINAPFFSNRGPKNAIPDCLYWKKYRSRSSLLQSLPRQSPNPFHSDCNHTNKHIRLHSHLVPRWHVFPGGKQKLTGKNRVGSTNLGEPLASPVGSARNIKPVHSTPDHIKLQNIFNSMAPVDKRLGGGFS